MPSAPPPSVVRRRRLVLVGVVAMLVVGLGAWFAYDTLVATEPEKAFALDLPSTTAARVLGESTQAGADEGAAADIAGRWTVAPGSEAGYRIMEDSVGGDNEVTGRTTSVSGTVTFTDDAVTAWDVSVDMASVATGQSMRDGMFRDSIMATGEFPTATFTQDEPVALDSVPEDGAPLSLSVPGTLTLRGVTNPAVAEVEGVLTGDAITVVGTVDVRLADFGIDPPVVPNLITVRDRGMIEFKVVLQRA
jgi:polyisoprenoid-binding protein YceI